MTFMFVIKLKLPFFQFLSHNMCSYGIKHPPSYGYEHHSIEVVTKSRQILYTVVHQVKIVPIKCKTKEIAGLQLDLPEIALK